MATQKQKFDLFQRLGALGFTYEEAQSLYRIQLTLNNWSCEECNGTIQRDETTGKPVRVYENSHRVYGGTGSGSQLESRYPIADREAGALKRLAAIIEARNSREASKEPFLAGYEYARDNGAFIMAYHQGDPRGCSLYLVKRSDLPDMPAKEIARLCGENAAKTPASRLRAIVSQYYTRGLAVCC